MIVTGIYYALGLAAGGAMVVLLTQPVFGAPLFLLAAFCLYFFRDPDREIPPGAVAVSAADGKVVAVKSEGNGRTRISIFLSIFDVHVNRSPIAGEITGLQYNRGRFLVASKEAASARNEQNVITVNGGDTQVVFKQIAGIIARRIIFDKKVGDHVEKGERVGLIRFGSRTDIVFGDEWEVVVQKGQRVKGGSSIVAKRKQE